MGKRSVALHHAAHSSLPIMAGYGFLGLTYGIYMHELGFSFLYPMLLAITVYAGSAEFLLGNMLLGSFHPLQAFLRVLMVPLWVDSSDLILPLISRAWTLCLPPCLPPYLPTTGFEKKTIQAVFPDLSSLGSAFLLLVPTISSYRA